MWSGSETMSGIETIQPESEAMWSKSGSWWSGC